MTVWRNRSMRRLDRGLRELLAGPAWRDAGDAERVELLLLCAADALDDRPGSPLPSPATVRRVLGEGRRDAEIRAQHAAGTGTDVLAERHRLSQRTVQRIVGARQD